MRLPSPKLATFQGKGIMLTYNTTMLFILHALFRADLQLQGRTYLLSIKVGHLSWVCNYRLVAHQVINPILWTMLWAGCQGAFPGGDVEN